MLSCPSCQRFDNAGAGRPGQPPRLLRGAGRVRSIPTRRERDLQVKTPWALPSSTKRIVARRTRAARPSAKRFGGQSAPIRWPSMTSACSRSPPTEPRHCSACSTPPKRNGPSRSAKAPPARVRRTDAQEPRDHDRRRTLASEVPIGMASPEDRFAQLVERLRASAR